MSLITPLANAVGAPEAALRLLLSIFASYPISHVYRKFIHPVQPKIVCQLFLTLAGIILYMLNYGTYVYHSFIAIAASFLFIQFLPTETLLVPVTFVFHFGYLIIGYIATATDNYDIIWTMPHCVLTLRLIGLSFDVADATVPVEKQSKDMKRFCLKEKPDLLEIATYSFFPAAFLIGPQFPMERLRRYLNHEFDQYTQYTQAGLHRLGQGVLLFALHQVAILFVNDSTLLSEDFTQYCYLWRLVLMGLWGKFVFWKYASCWMIAEGSLMVGGFSFAGKNEKGEEDWSAMVNSYPLKFETARKFQHYVESFNIQTNNWVAHYVYKRLKFLNNKMGSFLGTLLFLSVWHGFHSGYFMTFAMELFTVTMEKEIDATIERNVAVAKFFETPIGKIITAVVCHTYVFIFGGWNLVPFVLLNFTKWWAVYGAVWWIGLIFAPLAFGGGPILRALFPRTKVAKKVE